MQSIRGDLEAQKFTRVLAIAQSPLQLMGIAEWIFDYRPSEYDLVLIFDPRSVENANQMKMVIKLLGLKQFGIIETADSSSFFKYAKFIKKIKNVNYDCALIGGYSSLHQTLIANLNSCVFLIDDGADAFDVYRKMKQLGPNWGFRERGFKVFRFAFCGLNTQIKNKNRIFFYSCFLDSTVTFPRVIHHCFEGLKRLRAGKYSESHSQETTFFLDTPLVECGFLSPEIGELTYKYAKKLSNGSLIYIPHRAQLNSNSCLMASNLGIKVLTLDVPVELYFLTHGITPSRIFTTSTSAVFSLKKMFPNCLFWIFDIRFALKSTADLDSYNNYYVAASQSGMHVIPLRS